MMPENNSIIEIKPERIIITKTEEGYMIGAEYKDKPAVNFEVTEKNEYSKEYVLPHIKILEMLLRLFEIKEKQ